MICVVEEKEADVPKAQRVKTNHKLPKMQINYKLRIYLMRKLAWKKIVERKIIIFCQIIFVYFFFYVQTSKFEFEILIFV